MDIFTRNNLDFYQIVENSLNAILIYNGNEIVYSNSASFYLFGVKKQEQLQNSEFVHPFFREAFDEQINKVITKQETVEISEQMAIKTDGTILDIEVFATPFIKDDQVYAQVEIRDISKRKKFERDLRKSEDEYLLFSENVTEMMSKLTLDGRWLYVSSSSKEILGYPPEDLIGHSIHEFIHYEDLQKLEKGYASLLKTEKLTKPIRFRVRQKNDQYVWLETRAKVVTIDNEKVIVADSRNITEQVGSEKLLRESEKLSIVGELSAGVVHEIKNPLTALKGFLQIMKAEATHNKVYIDIMQTELESIEKIANDLLMFSKPKKDFLEPQNVVELLSQIVFLLDTQAFKKGVKIHWNPPTEPAIVKGDKIQLKQVFINLIKNAIEATDSSGEVHIKIAQEEKDFLSIQIKDSGCGIPEEKLAKIGQSFYSTKEKGTGLGLMITYKIIKDNHNGDILVESEVGIGTTFTVKLPFGELDQF